MRVEPVALRYHSRGDDGRAVFRFGHEVGIRRFPPFSTEYGPNQKENLRAEHAFDVVAEHFLDLARQLGC